MRVLVTGGRDYALPVGARKTSGQLQGDYEATTQYAVVCAQLQKLQASVVIHGDCRGADKAARRWAVEQHVPHIACPADWDALGKAAGMLRNQAMLDDHKPEIVLAFPGGSGTADMVDRAIKAGVPVVYAVPSKKVRLF